MGCVGLAGELGAVFVVVVNAGFEGDVLVY